MAKPFSIPYPVFHVPFPSVSISILHIRKRSVQNRERELDKMGFSRPIFWPSHMLAPKDMCVIIVVH
jgi:hypothetical protein